MEEQADEEQAQEEGQVVTWLYPAITIGAHVHQVGFGISNGMSDVVTVRALEIVDKNGDIVHEVTRRDIRETWGSEDIQPGGSLTGGISFALPVAEDEVEAWQITCYYQNAAGEKATVEGDVAPR